MPILNRRKFVGSAAAGLLLAPFVSLLERRSARAANKQAKRLLLFCTMGTNPDIWSPTGVTAQNAFTFSACTAPSGCRMLPSKACGRVSRTSRLFETKIGAVAG